MDFWKSDYEAGDTASVLAGLQDFVDSPHSSNSLEYSSDSLVSEQIESFKIKSTPKTALLAKKRLQAYYAVNKLKLGGLKEEKSVKEAPKSPVKKANKTVYPDEAQKAVIRDIEVLKKAGFGYCGPITSSPVLPMDIMVPSDSIVPISLAQAHSESSVISLVPDEGNNIFRKREIKCRNIRKSDTYRKRSVSPKTTREKSDSQKKDKKKYPKNWAEYKELGLTPQKDASLKSKLLKKSKNRKFDFQQYFTFESSPVPIEEYKYKLKTGETARVPFSYLRCTASKPHLLYSTTQHVPPGHLTRDQLYGLISKEGKSIIEKLGKPTRCEPKSNITVRKWYPKNWKKTDNSEGKLLEKSVGLSFLQSYSDEEEEVENISEVLNEEEVIGKVADIIRENIGVNLAGSEEVQEKEEFTPSATPEAAPRDLDEDIEKDKLKKSKKSRWDDLVDIVGPRDYVKTPPIEEKEEGEVLTDEEQLREENLCIDDYEKTKEELEKLEAVLKSSAIDYVETENVIKEVPKIKQTDEKKRKKVDKKKIAKQKSSKKRLKKKKREKKQKVVSPSTSEPSEPEEEVKKKKKHKNKKKDSKTKPEKDKKSKQKNKKIKKKKADVVCDNTEGFDQMGDLEANTSKKQKKRKKKLNEITRKRTASDDSRTKVSDNRKNTMMDITPENYEDDIKFFAARFDAENKLKGKTKHKTTTNITLEELTVDEKLSETSLVSDTTPRKKNKEEPKQEVEGAEKKDEIKIDLLKLNDDYLREQKRKEEMSVVANEEETIKETIVVSKESQDDSSAKEPPVIATPEVERLEDIKLPDDDEVKSPQNHPNWEEIRNKRKRRRSDNVGENADKKPRDIEDIEVAEEIPLENIKKEEDAETQLTELNNSWETDEELLENHFNKDTSLDLEIPLNIKPFHRREIKIEEEEEVAVKEPQLVSEELDMEELNDKSAKRNLNLECIDLDSEAESPTKKRRWDIKSCASTPLIKQQNPSNIIDLEANNCVTLENEYEEFMKAVTSTKESIIIDSSSDSSVTVIDESKPDSCVNESSPAAIQIPLPPVKVEPIDPVPVPSPKLEAVLELNKPLINLSVSANVTQNITLSLATSMPSFSAPITSSIDIYKPSFEISDALLHSAPFSLNHDTANVINPDVFTINRLPAEDDLDESNMANQKLVFTSISLPSKKLLDNSKLNLDDSDNDDQYWLEEMKRKKLEALIEDNKREALKEQVKKSPKAVITSKEESSRKQPTRRSEATSRRLKPEAARHNRDSPSKRRELSPRRRSSPRRKSPKRRSPIRRKKSPGRRSISPRRQRRSSLSPRRRRSPSPRRKRTPSPRSHRSHGSPSPKSKRANATSSLRRKSPVNQRETSPLKRSLADSTISDDQLPQAQFFEELLQSKMQEKTASFQSPKRVPLDVRINQVLGYDQPSEASPKPTTFYHGNETVQQHYQFVEEQYSSIQSQVTSPTLRNIGSVMRTPQQSTYKQVGNMLQIVPTEDNLTDIPMPHQVPQTDMAPKLHRRTYQPSMEHKQMPHTPVELRPQILQVGNMLQIVPTEMVPTELIPVPPPVLAEIKTEKLEDSWLETSFTSPCLEKPSAEASMLLKVVERRAERENRRQEREKRRKEKEKRRKEKEKARQAKMKVKTENMIKRALELEEEEEEEAEADSFSEPHMRWPPTPIIVGHSVLKEAGKSILLNTSARQFDDSFDERRSKVVQFADGIRPGEGTSPSAGEDLSSPPPPKKKLPKEKRYKKLKFGKKNAKKKVKVKIIKKQPSPLDESDSDDTLPPPSPPPGSPPPHVFPPRIKVNPVNNVPAAYLASIIQTAQQQQQLQQQQPPHQQAQYQSSLFRSPINLLMAPPPLPQSHLSAVQSPHGVAMPPALSPQSHYHPGLTAPPPPPPPPTHSSGHNRHY